MRHTFFLLDALVGAVALSGGTEQQTGTSGSNRSSPIVSAQFVAVRL